MSRVRDVVLVLLGLAAGTGGGWLLKSPGATPVAVAGASRAEEHAEGTVELSDAKLAAAGIVLEPAGPVVLRDGLRLNGTIAANQERTAQVTPRFAGLVRDVRKRLGERVEKGDVLAIVESNQSLTGYELKAPLAGTIIGREVALGEYVSEQKPAFVIADLASLWVDLAVYSRDFAKVHVGQTVLVEPSDGSAAIESRVAYVSPVGSADTQSALARVTIENRDGRLRPGLFVTGRVVLDATSAAVAVRASALQTVEGKTVVFVREGDDFVTRPVRTGARDPEFVEILDGVAAGEAYAAANSFVIKAELAKGSTEHAH